MRKCLVVMLLFENIVILRVSKFLSLIHNKNVLVLLILDCAAITDIKLHLRNVSASCLSECLDVCIESTDINSKI